MLSPSGQRLKQTLRKLPKARPKRPAKSVPNMRIIPRLSIRLLRHGGWLSVGVSHPFRRKKRKGWGTEHLWEDVDEAMVEYLPG
jgi:hypothetical protein